MADAGSPDFNKNVAWADRADLDRLNHKGLFGCMHHGGAHGYHLFLPFILTFQIDDIEAITKPWHEVMHTGRDPLG